MTEPTLLFSLPADFFCHSILPLCVLKDQRQLAATCRYFWEHIEEFSGHKLTQMQEQHAVDASWRDRVVMEATRGMNGSFPLALSQRQKLKCAQQTNLFSLSDRRISNYEVQAVLCLPDRNFVVTAGGDSAVMHMWDLTSKQVVRTFQAVPGSYVLFLHYVSGRIVATRYGGSVGVWRLDGTHEHTFTGHDIFRGSPSGNELIFCSKIGDGSFYGVKTLNIFTGTVIEYSETQWEEDSIGEQNAMELAMANGNVLVLVPICFHEEMDEGPTESQQEVAGVYLLDRSDFSTRHVAHGDYVAMAVSENGARLAARKMNGEINIMVVQSDQLVVQYSLDHRHHFDNAAWFPTMVMYLSGSKLYTARNFHPSDDRVAQINVFKLYEDRGEHERAIYYQPTEPFTDDVVKAYVLASNGQELFCGFDERSRNPVRAYHL